MSNATSLLGAAKSAETVAPRELPYIPSQEFAVFGMPGTGFLGRSRKRSDEQVIGYQDGPTQRAVPLATVAAGIAEGVLDPADIVALLVADEKKRAPVLKALKEALA